MATYALKEPRWFLRMGPVESWMMWAFVRFYMDREHELGGRVVAAMMRGER